MLSQKSEVIEGITVPEEFVDLLKCSVEDIWSDDDEFFDKKDYLRTENLKKYFKYYKLVPKRRMIFLLRDEKNEEQIKKKIIDAVERKNKSKYKTTRKNSKRSCRSEHPNDTAEQCSRVCSKDSDESNKLFDVHFSSCDKESNILTSDGVKEFNETELDGYVNDNNIYQKMLSEDYNKTIMAVTSNDLCKLKKRKHEVSFSDSSDLSILSKKHCNRDKYKVEHAVSNSKSDSSNEKHNINSEKIDNKISVHVSAENNKFFRSLEGGENKRNGRSEWQSGKNSEESGDLSKCSFISKQSLVNTQKRDTVNCVEGSDTSDENRSVVNLKSPKKKISRFVSKKLYEEEDNMVFVEEVTSDDEAWVIQAPKSMNVDSLYGQSINLNDNFLLRDNNGKTYEGFVSSIGNKRNASLIIPSVKSKSLKLRALPVAGSIIIEEKVNVPHAATPVSHKKTKIPLPQGLRQRHPLLGTDKISHSVSDESDIYSSVEKKKKKKKKKHENSVTSGTDEMNNISIMNESELGGALKQKKKMKHSNITNIETDNVMSKLESHNSVKRKKKKKHSEINEAEIIGTVTTELESKRSTRNKNKKKGSYIHDSGTEMVDNFSNELGHVFF